MTDCNFHIYAPEAFTYRTIRECPSCGGTHRMLITKFVWHEMEWECGFCGASSRGGNGKREKAERIKKFNPKWLKSDTRKEGLRKLMQAVSEEMEYNAKTDRTAESHSDGPEFETNSSENK